MGATVKPVRRSQNACVTGLRVSVASTVGAVAAVRVDMGRGTSGALRDVVLDFRNGASFRQVQCVLEWRMDRDQRDAAIGDIASLDQPVRRAIYDLLVERDDWVGRDDAADAVDVPRSVAAFHLDKLVEADLAETRFERPPGRAPGPGAGRPAKKYRRGGRGVALSLPARQYDLAGALLADAVADATATGGAVGDALATAARATGREMGEAVRAELADAGTQLGRRRGAAASAAM